MVLISQCMVCRHFRQESGETLTCDAYRERIPDPIFFNEKDHRRPLPGDHGIQWDALEPPLPHPMTGELRDAAPRS